MNSPVCVAVISHRVATRSRSAICISTRTADFEKPWWNSFHERLPGAQVLVRGAALDVRFLVIQISLGEDIFQPIGGVARPHAEGAARHVLALSS
jgi:hypothetical protein